VLGERECWPEIEEGIASGQWLGMLQAVPSHIFIIVIEGVC